MSDTQSQDLAHPIGKTRLIVSPDDREALTFHFETDVRTAVTRGLKEYAEQLRIDWPGGRQSRFAKVLSTWSEPEVPAEFPSAVVYASEPGVYDARSFTPSTVVLVDGRPIRLVAEFSQQVVFELWSTDPRERYALVRMMEDALSPVDWMYGCRLELPHYHNARVTLEPLSMAYLDVSDEAQRRYRRAAIVVTATCPVVRAAFDPVIGRLAPPLEVRADSDATESSGVPFVPGGVATGVGGGVVDLTKVGGRTP